MSKWLALWAIIGFFACQGPKEPPNILLIVTDDQGWGDAGFHGNEVLKTPVLDSLARNSLIFDRFYVSPVCAPTRASLLTGRYHLATGTSWVTHRREVMSSEEVTIAELLQPVGYRSGLFGKWHNGKQFPHDPVGQGFQDFVGFTDGHANNYFDPVLQVGHELQAFEGYMPDILTDKAIKFMAADDPFFCYVSYNTPHSPFQVPNEYFDTYKAMGLDDRLACIYGMVANIDQNIGRLLAALEASGKAENTLIIFMTDNGPNGYRYNGPWKGIKSHVDEGGVHVPFLMHFSGKGWNTGEHIAYLAAHIDILPTIAEVVGAAVPDSLGIHGESLVGVMAGKTKKRLFFTHQVVRKMDTIPGAVRSDSMVLTLKADTALYDLKNDPSQQVNLAETWPEVRRSFASEYQHWFEQVTSEGIVPPPIEVGHPVRRIILPAPDASAFAGVRFSGGEGWANDFFVQEDSGAWMSWDILVKNPSAYRLRMAYSSPQPTSVEVRIGKRKHTLKVPPAEKVMIPSPDRVPRGEVYAFHWGEAILPSIHFSPSDEELTVHLVGAVAGWELKKLTLERLE
ncbi:arylsulfatase [Marinoscillum furvescens]|uniref:Arylsulfatase A n=1 Tax=Marinoscillum furvescens DSM 4134 TaxID=1122208 RepID=A0A3D9L064_MARFU|nr:arylsulfatase [Marinoscillum furvescens]RED95283.1 arylsulfatase A [Marinoscillum furvescens DSM 4134]